MLSCEVAMQYNDGYNESVLVSPTFATSMAARTCPGSAGARRER